MAEFRFDEIGYWSEVKLSIIKEYAAAYSRILTKQPRLEHVYIDGFAGGGLHISKSSEDIVPGSPWNALRVDPPFYEYHLVDLNSGKADSLRELAASRPDLRVFVYEDDCNEILCRLISERVRYEDYRRGLCILDPYGLHLDWDLVAAAGRSKTVDMFLNFPTMDMNRNALWHDSARVDPRNSARMTRFWGDETWSSIAYTKQFTLFDGAVDVKTSIAHVVQAYSKRLSTVAGFNYVCNMPMRNNQGGVVYHLFFASANETAHQIAKAIFRKYA